MDVNIRLTQPNPSRSSNLVSRLFFTWLLKLFYNATKNTLKLTDLYQNLPEDKSETLCDRLEKYWNDELAVAKAKNTTPSLVRAIRRAFFWKYMGFGFVLFFEAVVIRTVQPIILAIFIKSFSDELQNNSDQSLLPDMYWSGIGIVLTSFVLLFFQHHLNVIFGHIGMEVRIATCSLMYRKVLRMSKKSLAQSAAGQIVNLMSNDVSRFDLVALALHYIWIMPLQAVVVTYLIWEQVEVAAVIGVGSLIILTIPLNTYAGKISATLRTKIAYRTDRRIKKMSEIISGIQVIKMYAWEKPFSKTVHNERVNEIKVLTWQSYLRGVILSSCVFLERTVLYITVIAYVLLGNHITADKVFSMAQFFNLLQFSMAVQYPQATTMGSETLISIKRIQEFLMLEDRPECVLDKNSSKALNFKNVSASWTSNTQLLSNVNFTINPGSLCAIVGPVGTGKTSLMQLLLGELIPNQGLITVGGNTSYASQEPWLFASSVQKNILFGQKYDKSLYNSVVRACALEKDFKQFPNGDKTSVGEKGISLSGGQKARINLARAVYRDADIYLLDDPLSAVDTHVGKHLFQKCIMEYLHGKTRVLITHQLQYLKEADLIIVVNGGTIEAQGTFEQLSNADIDFTKMLAAANDGDETPTAVQNDLLLSNQRSSTTSCPSVTTYISDNVKEDVGAQENEESVTHQGASAYYQYFRAGGNFWVLLGLVMFFVGGQIICNVSDLWLTQWTMNEETYNTKCNNIQNNYYVSSNDAKSTILYDERYDKSSSNSSIISDVYQDEDTILCNSITSSNTAIYIYTALILLGVLLLTTRSLYFYKVVMNSSTNLHNKMFYALLQAPMRFFDTNPCGRILNRFSRDMGMIDELLPRHMSEALQIFLVMIGILVMVIITNVYIIAVSVVLGIGVYFVQGFYVTNARYIKHLEGIAKSPMFSHVTATVDGITTIRATAAEQILQKEFDLHQDTHTSAWYLTLLCTSAFGLWIDLFSVLFITCAIIGFILLHLYGAVNGSLVGLAISQSMILTGMVQYGIQQIAAVISQMTSVERVLEYTNIEREGTTSDGSQKCVTPPKTWPTKGAVTFDSVFLRYSEAEPYVLKNLNFCIKPGEKIGIVGRTGAGKSSLISALFRLATLEGTIKIDDIDTKTIGLGDLRRKISIIPQEPFLFSATLRYNLDPFGEFSDELLWNALAEVELKDVAASLDYMIDEGGCNLSVGQRQLLCLARAILRENKILILDEATANVDPKTDALIQKTIRQKFSKYTVLTVAHRLHTIMDSSKVLVMDEGAMVEYDNPYTLLQNNSGVFYKMVEETGPAMSKQLHDVAKTLFMKTNGEVMEDKDTHL